ncbi:MAG: DUF3108 domain-containing protein [Gammaproteobacteria bacterium]|nr:DUF3108 domain-containing protein [Gammaproteobacteria bacterium]
MKPTRSLIALGLAFALLLPPLLASPADDTSPAAAPVPANILPAEPAPPPPETVVPETSEIVPAPPPPLPALTAFKAEYRFTRNRFHLANLIRRLKPLGNDRYQFSSETEAVGPLALFLRDTVSDQSTLAVINGRLQPVHYLYLHQRSKDPLRTEFTFDWSTSTVSGISKNRPLPPTAVPADTQDKLSYQLLMMLDLMAGKQELHYPLQEDKGLRDYIFDVVGHETMTTRIGRLDTVKLMRRNDKRQSTFWCAEKLNYLPVKFTQIEKDGALLELELTSVSNLPWPRR